ncbi:hypothetical protein AAUPMC_19924, partial [Pasteurella multocida subsp. multocida str. Anand1_cattle]
MRLFYHEGKPILNTLVDFIIDKLDDLKATDILRLDVRGKSPITDD